ncbi:helix-turn-helix transcriptional regulator [Roseomonas chloroacetimidivorans]|uniref:helix-turn-helix transcriptional regulator n=1 Tax=Roseomonas chloroacetimidivorans TaxID=1766656 RepID=UPI003C766E52
MQDISLPSRQARLGELLRLAMDMAGSREGLSLSDIANRVGVSRRTAERLLAVLKAAFPAIQSVPGDGRSLRWCLPHGHLSPLLAPTHVELTELDAAAGRLRREGAPPERAAALEGLAVRVRAAMRAGALRRVTPDVEALMEAEGTAARPGPRPVLAHGLLATIREAVLSCRELDVTYARRGAEPVVRRLWPLGVLHGSLPYLVGSVVGTPGDPTLFRLDRVRAVAVRTEVFVRDPTFDLATWAEQSFGVFQGDSDEVVLRFSADVADDTRAWRFHGTQTTEDLPDGRLIVRFTACGRREMIHHLATWGEHVEVLEPDDLRRELANWARGIAAHHRRVPRGDAKEPDTSERVAGMAVA